MNICFVSDFKISSPFSFSCLGLHPLKPLQSLPHLHLIYTIRCLSHINFFNFLFCSLVSKLHHLLNEIGEKENRDSKDRIEGPFDGDFQQTESWIVDCSRKPMRFLSCAGQLLLSLSLSLPMETLMRRSVLFTEMNSQNPRPNLLGRNRI